MPKIRSLASFDLLFQRTTEAALRFHSAGIEKEGGVLIRVPCQSQGQCMNAQMQFRQYWQALRRGVETGEITIIDPRHSIAERCSELATRANSKDKKVMEIVHRSGLAVPTQVAKAMKGIEAALAELPELTPSYTPPPLPADTALDNAIRKAEGKGDAQTREIEKLYGIKEGAGE